MNVQTDIATDLTRILGAKSDLKTSIEGKGVTVPSATKIDGYAALVDQIQQGGGGGHTGTVDTVGLTTLGWDAQDIQWLQDHVWWDAEDDAEWAVTEANKAFGPTGATPLTWNTRSSIQYNSDCRYLPKLTPTGTSYSSIFNNYYHLVAIPTHGWVTSSITSFNQAFYGCAALRSIGDISYWVTSTATSIMQMFYGCVSLAEIDVSHWDTQNVTSFQQTFVQCGITNIDLSNWSFAKVTSMQSMFSSAFWLKDIKFPQSISAPKLTTIFGVFQYAYSLENISITMSAPLLTTIASAFYGCYKLKTAYLSIASTVLNTATAVFFMDNGAQTIDLQIDTTACDQTGVSSSAAHSPAGYAPAAATINLGANFFKGSFTTLYMQNSNSWTRDSIYESLYTNQTTRNSNSNAVTVKLATQAYDRLSAQDISDIATKNITLTRG